MATRFGIRTAMATRRPPAVHVSPLGHDTCGEIVHTRSSPRLEKPSDAKKNAFDEKKSPSMDDVERCTPRHHGAINHEEDFKERDSTKITRYVFENFCDARRSRVSNDAEHTTEDASDLITLLRAIHDLNCKVEDLKADQRQIGLVLGVVFDHSDSDLEFDSDSMDDKVVISLRNFNDNKDATRILRTHTAHVAPGHMRELVSSDSKEKSTPYDFKVSGSGIFSSASRASCFAAIREALPLKPDSKLSLTFDITGAILLIYDSMMIPYVIAWSRKTEGWLLYATLTTAVFWTLDMITRFVTCVVKRDVVVQNLYDIAIYYLKHWFFVDFMLVSFDWFGIVWETTRDTTGPSRASTIWLKLVRALKISRMVRIIAMVKTGKFAKIQDVVMQQAHVYGMKVAAQFFGSLLQLVFAILWLCHFGACAFTMVEKNNAGMLENASWEKLVANWFNDEARTFDDVGMQDFHLYLLAYYWALTTMFSGASFLPPHTALEFIFSSLAVLCGALFASSIISSMAAMLMDIHEARREQRTELEKMRTFLRQHHIESTLSWMIERQISERIAIKRRLVESDVHVMSFLSAELRGELHFCCCFPLSSRHPVWSACDCIDDHLIRNLSKHAIRCQTSTPGEVLFELQAPMDHSYTIAWGTMLYTPLFSFKELRETFSRRTAERAAMVKALRKSTRRTQRRRTAFAIKNTIARADNPYDASAKFQDLTTVVSMGSMSSSIFVNAAGQSTVPGRLRTSKRSSNSSNAFVSHAGSASERSSIAPDAEIVTTGQEICGIAVWATWSTMGMLEAINPCEFLSCSYAGVREVLSMSNARAQIILRGYAAAIVDFVAKELPQGLNDLSSRLDHDSVVAFMEKEPREMMSMPAWKLFRTQSVRRTFAMEEGMREELRVGKCSLRQDESGKVVRVVRLAVMRLCRPDGLICVQLGYLERHEVPRVKIVLPGIKMKTQQTVMECTSLLLDRLFQPFKSLIIVKTAEFDMDARTTLDRSSPRYGIDTRYVRYLSHATIRSYAVEHSVSWNDVTVECFSAAEGDGDSQVLNIFAWFSQDDFDTLIALSSEVSGELALSWLSAFHESQIKRIEEACDLTHSPARPTVLTQIDDHREEEWTRSIRLSNQSTEQEDGSKEKDSSGKMRGAVIIL